MRLTQLGFLRQNAADNGGGRHGQCARSGKRPVKRRAHCHQNAHNREHGNDDLQTTQAEYEAAHGFEFGQGEFETDAEHQEHNADFAQIVGSVALRNQFEHTRTGNKTDQKITEHGRNVEFATADNRNNGNQQDNDNGTEGEFVHRVGGLSLKVAIVI